MQQMRTYLAPAFLMLIHLLCSAVTIPPSFAREQTLQRSPSPIAAPVQQDKIPDELVEKVKISLKTGVTSAAEKETRTYIETHPNSGDGHYLLGLLLFKQGKAVESLAEYTEGAKHRDPTAEDLKIVALDYVLLGNFGEADRWLTRSVIWNPNDVEAWYHLGRTKYNESHFEQSLAAFQRCLQLDPKNAKAEANLGLSFAALGKFASADQAYRQSIAWQSVGQPKLAEPFIDLSVLLLDQNNADEALSFLLQADAVFPEDPRVAEMLGKVYWRQNNLQEARTQLEKATKLTPKSVASHYLLGQVYRKQGLPEKAKIEFDLAASLSSARPAPQK